MFIRSFVVTAAVLAASPAAANLVDWELRGEGGGTLGGFRLDFSTREVSGLYIGGEVNTYTLASTFIFLDTLDNVAGHPVRDFLLFFSPISGARYYQDYGGGEYSEIVVNEAAVRLGTLEAPLSAMGGVFDVVIDEVYNFDETNVYCSSYEEIYDPETGDYLGDGPCVSYYNDSYYNVEAGYHHYGTLVGTPVVVATPLPGGLALLAGGLGLLAARAGRRRA